MSSSTPIQFLLDENVRIELAEFLTEKGINFKNAKKSSVGKTLAKISLAEKCIIVTNDSDFSEMRKDEVFGVVWLRLPQKDSILLIRKFGEMLAEEPQYAGSLVILEREKRLILPLMTLVRSEKIA